MPLVNISEEKFKKLVEEKTFKESDNVEKNFIPKDRFNEVNDKYKNEAAKYKAECEKSALKDKKITEMNKAVEGSEDYKKQFEDFKVKNDNDIKAKDDEIAAKEKANINQNKMRLLSEKLKNAGARHPNLLLKNIDLETISIENENVLGFDPQLETMKKDYSDMFEIKKSTNNVNTGNNNLDNNEEFNNIDWAARAKEYLD